MSRTRHGSLALLVGLLAAAASPAPAAAQTAPGAPEAAGSWIDPPVRGSDAPQATPRPAGADVKAGPDAAAAPSGASTAKPASPGSNTAKSASPESDAAKSVAARPVPPRPAASRPPAPVAARPAARLPRGFAIRRLPVPIPRLARAPAPVERVVVVPRHRPVARAPEPAPRAYGHARFAARGAFYPGPYEAYLEPPMQARRAGWGGLATPGRWRRDAWEADGDGRIAQARAAGYHVMRMRTFAGPDGRLVRSLTPLDADPFD